MRGTGILLLKSRDFLSRTILVGAITTVLVAPLAGQSAEPSDSSTQVAKTAPAAAAPAAAAPAAAAPAAAAPAAAAPVTTYEPNHFPKREHSYYELFWGVDSLNAKAVESGELIKFTYRVIDPQKARSLNDKTIQPVLYDPAIRAKLVIPSLEKVGQLRQAQTPEAGKTYWMAFSNPGRVVKKGDRVTVVIGDFHIEGLVVQ